MLSFVLGPPKAHKNLLSLIKLLDFVFEKKERKLEAIFDKHNEIRSHKLENQLIYVIPNYFSCIEDYLFKFKTLRLLLKDCKIEMKDDQCIYVIIVKLNSAYYVYVSTFHFTGEALGASYTIPLLSIFVIP